jgi:hypothetical protein
LATPTDPGAPSGPPDPPNVPAPAPLGPLPAGTSVIGAIQITDAGGIRIVTVKAGSTASAAVDPSLVVALSPNSPVPAGPNAIGSVNLNAPLPSGANVIGAVNINNAPNSYAEGSVVVTANGTPILFKDDAVPNTLRIASSTYPLPTAIINPQLQIKGGTGQIANVKAAATAAVAGDTALVVAQSPNTPLPAGANLIGNVGLVAGTALVGKIEVSQQKTLKSVAIDNGGAAGDFDIIAAVAAKRLKVYAISLQAKAATDVKLKSPAGDITGAFSFGAREGITLSVTPPTFLFGTAAGDKLTLNSSAAVSVVGLVSYFDDDAT